MLEQPVDTNCCLRESLVIIIKKKSLIYVSFLSFKHAVNDSYMSKSVFTRNCSPFPPQQPPHVSATYNSVLLFRFLFTARQNNPDHPISSHPSHSSASRRCSNSVIDPVFRPTNNSLFPDKALFSGTVVVAVQSLCSPLLQQGCRFLHYCHSGWEDAAVVASFYCLLSLVAFLCLLSTITFPGCFPCGEKLHFTLSLFLSRSFYCSARFMSLCLFPSHPMSPIPPSSTTKLGGVLCHAVCRKSGVLAVVLCQRRISPQS